MRVPGGYVYFVRCGDFVKIGHAEWPEYRMKFLQVASPLPMTLIGQVPGNAVVERIIHRELREHRHRGEWFRWTPEVQDFVESKLRAEGVEGKALPPRYAPTPAAHEQRAAS